MNVLSLFNGFGGLALVLDMLGITPKKIYSSEIDKYANQSAQALYPGTIQMGDITKWRDWDIDWSEVSFVGGGPPCQGFSFAGKQAGTKACIDGVDFIIKTREQYLKAKIKGAFFYSQSHLFWEFVLCLDHVIISNPSAKFMVENVKMKKEFLNMITGAIGVEPILINSALVGPQNRVRNYWHNIGLVEQPEDTKAMLIDILEDLPSCPVGIAVREKSKCVRVGGKNSPFGGKHEWDSPFQRVSKKGKIKPGIEKACCLTDGANSGGNHSDMDILRTEYVTRRYSVRECARLQGMPEHKIDILLNCGISNTQLYKMIGNGWQLDTVKHVLGNLKDYT